MKKFMPILQDYYPETLKTFYVIGVNAFWRAAWQIVKFFVSKRTEQKINILEDAAVITKFIDVSNLASEYGGKLSIEDRGKI
jgi:hypothetical protein